MGASSLRLPVWCRATNGSTLSGEGGPQAAQAVCVAAGGISVISVESGADAAREDVLFEGHCGAVTAIAHPDDTASLLTRGPLLLLAGQMSHQLQNETLLQSRLEIRVNQRDESVQNMKEWGQRDKHWTLCAFCPLNVT